MDSDVRAEIESLYASNTHKVVVYATGGAAQALSWLLTVPGASSTILEARVPYGGARSWADALSSTSLPSSLASAPAAAALADAAYRQAAQLSPFVPPDGGDGGKGSSFEIVGVGCSCALATGRDRRGGDRIFVAARVGSRGVFSASVVGLPRGSLSSAPAPLPGSSVGSRLLEREAQDEVASRLLLRTLGRALGRESLSSLGLFSATSAPTTTTTAATAEEGAAASARAAVSSSLEERFEEAEDPISSLLAGRARCVELGGGMPPIVDAPRGVGRVYLSGSFNPLHPGHVGLLDASVAAAEAEKRAEEAGKRAEEAEGAEEAERDASSGAPLPAASVAPVDGAFELSVVNADKGTLTEEEVRRRVAQFDLDEGDVDEGDVGADGGGTDPAGGGGKGRRGSRRRRRVVLTRAPLFEDKAALFGRGASFVVGVDTAVRLLDPKYYLGGSEAGLGVCMGRIAARGAKVFVAGRKVKRASGAGAGGAEIDGPGQEERFVTLGSSGALESSPAAKVVASLGLFREIPEERFRVDVSSTELRERARKEAAAKAAATGEAE